MTAQGEEEEYEVVIPSTEYLVQVSWEVGKEVVVEHGGQILLVAESSEHPPFATLTSVGPLH